MCVCVCILVCLCVCCGWEWRQKEREMEKAEGKFSFTNVEFKITERCLSGRIQYTVKMWVRNLKQNLDGDIDFKRHHSQ